MDKGKASLMGEETLWQLYRRLLGATLLKERLSDGHATWRNAAPLAAIAAALTENLIEGDTLGLLPGDLVTRYLFGMPTSTLRCATQYPGLPPRRTAATTWSLSADASHGILPCKGVQQANLAVGTALGARMHGTGLLTTLVQGSTGRRASTQSPPPPDLWAEAAQTAVSLQLPLLFLSEAKVPSPSEKVHPARPAPAIPSIPVDRNDTVALYRVIYEAAARARSGGGPTWIDCRDASLPVRARHTDSERDQSSLAMLEQSLRSRQFFSRDRQRHVRRSLEKEFAAAGWHLRPGP